MKEFCGHSVLRQPGYLLFRSQCFACLDNNIRQCYAANLVDISRAYVSVNNRH